MTTTTDFSKFGARERGLLIDILTAWDKNGLPSDFNEDNVQIMFNMDSGNVFLTNEECQVAMMDGDNLESFYSCPECGHEGFFEEMQHGDKDACIECYNDIKNNR